jgi:hypothetical protein
MSWLFSKISAVYLARARYCNDDDNWRVAAARAILIGFNRNLALRRFGETKNTDTHAHTHNYNFTINIINFNDNKNTHVKKIFEECVLKDVHWHLYQTGSCFNKNEYGYLNI